MLVVRVHLDTVDDFAGFVLRAVIQSGERASNSGNVVVRVQEF